MELAHGRIFFAMARQSVWGGINGAAMKRSATGAELGSDAAAVVNAAGVYQRARRHSRRVRFLKFALPTLAVLVAGGFGLSSWIASSGMPSIDITSTAVRDGKLVMANPKLDGFTKENLPYSMNALRAVQDLSDTSRIALEEITARLPVDAGKWADVVAASGTFDNERNLLDIASPMTVKTNDGMEARFQSAVIELASGRLETADPVEIDLNGSHVSADSMKISDRGKLLVFERRVRVRIDAKLLNSDKAGAAE
jgi:lipopolysaccharide export system protein LptC